MLLKSGNILMLLSDCIVLQIDMLTLQNIINILVRSNVIGGNEPKYLKFCGITKCYY